MTWTDALAEEIFARLRARNIDPLTHFDRRSANTPAPPKETSMQAGQRKSPLSGPHAVTPKAIAAKIAKADQSPDALMALLRKLPEAELRSELAVADTLNGHALAACGRLGMTPSQWVEHERRRKEFGGAA